MDYRAMIIYLVQKITEQSQLERIYSLVRYLYIFQSTPSPRRETKPHAGKHKGLR